MLAVSSDVGAMRAHRSLAVGDKQLSASVERLSSGYRINRAADDASGLAISEGLRAQIGGLRVAVRNTQDGISEMQTAEGALAETHGVLQRMRDLSVQAADDGGLSDESRATLQGELSALGKELDRIAGTTWNGTKLLDGTFSASFQVGTDAADTLGVTLDTAMTAGGLGVAGIDVSAGGGSGAASAAIGTIDAAIATVSTARGALGAVQNRFEHTIDQLGVSLENLTGSESRIRDADVAQESMQFARNQILVQAGTAMLAQANRAPQGVLALLN